MKYEICYIDKTSKNFQQKLETFSEFQDFKIRYQYLLKKPLHFFVEGVSIYRTSKDELHEIVLIDKEKNFILMYKSTEFGIDALISLISGSNLEVLNSSIYYD